MHHDRARRACFDAGSLRDLPERWREEASNTRIESVRNRCASSRSQMIASVYCSSPDVAFTYFEIQVQRKIGDSLVDALRAGGGLVLGAHE